MWKCKNCNEITEGPINATTGYCKKCKEHHLLERYDPLNDPLDKEGGTD